MVVLLVKNLDLKRDLVSLYDMNLKLQKQNEELSLTKENLYDQLNESDDTVSNLKLALALESVDNSLDNTSDGKSVSMGKKIEKKFLKTVPNGFPLVNQGITDNYGMRIHPISRVERFHHGIDLRAKAGTPLYATADGIIEYSSMTNSGYGYLVIISHNFGFQTRYGHMQDEQIVKVGDFVKKGDLIGYSGNTGYSTGPHLHYEVRFLGRTLDPKNFIEFNNIFYDERKVPWRSLIGAIEEF